MPIEGLSSLSDAFAKALQRKYTTFRVLAESEPEEPIKTYRTLKLLRDETVGATSSNHISPERGIAQLHESDSKSNCKVSPALQNLIDSDPNCIREVQRVDVKILAILILMKISNIGSMLAKIWEENLVDGSLPFDPFNGPTTVNDYLSDQFCVEQWHVLSVTLRPLVSMEDLSQFELEQILPYDSRRKLGAGSFGTVSDLTLQSYQELFAAW